MIKWKLAAALCAFALNSGPGLTQPAPERGPLPPRLTFGSISNFDYPADAIRAREQGTVRIQIDVGADGSVVRCQIAQSSGSPTLDMQTCALATQRFRFEPGRNAQGEAAASVYRQSVRWVLPDDAPQGMGSQPFDSFRIVIVANLRAGQVDQCTQGSDLTPAQPVPVAVCTGVFDEALSWAAGKADVTQLTQVISRALLPAPPTEVRAEWGATLVLAEAEMTLAPDGAVADCIVSRNVSGNDADGLRPTDACTLGGPPGTSFEPTTDVQPRRARIVIATFARRQR